MRVIVTGASGFLGRRLMRALHIAGAQAVGTWSTTPREGLERLDITDARAVDEAFAAGRFDVCIHAAARCNLDDCERHRTLASTTNVVGTGHVVEACRRTRTRLVYVSTDHVFDGAPASAYVETDAPRPLQHYGVTKREGELLALTLEDALVLRVPLLYGLAGPDEKATFVTSTLERLAAGQPVYADGEQVRYPVLVDEVAAVLARLAEGGVGGVLHFSGAEATTKYSWARRLAHAFNLDVTLVHARKESSLAARPRDNRLGSTRLSALGFEPPLTLTEGLDVLRHQREAAR
ncbi:SDR family oxidoreductase [Myxococcus fulvus]|uniref:SDR family oxidoreductase n=1 Tax=Myxococcus fulvus TaxID=33 RepID=UPI000943F351|nr:SDR family oxidoreductase [Myxococcus fulvus]